MAFTKLIVALAFLATGALVAHEPKVTQVLSKDLTDIPGKEGLMLTVEYPPGGFVRHECSEAHLRPRVKRFWVSDDLARIFECGQSLPD